MLPSSSSSAAWNPIFGSILDHSIGSGGHAQVVVVDCRLAHHALGSVLAPVDVGSALAAIVVFSRTAAPSSSPSLRLSSTCTGRTAEGAKEQAAELLQAPPGLGICSLEGRRGQKIAKFQKRNHGL